MTGWGGQLDFLGPDWPYLVDYEMTPVMSAIDCGSYHPSQNWASASLGDAVELLRAIKADPTSARSRCSDRSEAIKAQFDEEAVGQRLLEVLKRDRVVHR